MFSELKLPLDQEGNRVISEFEKESAQLQQAVQLAEVEKQTHHMFEFASTILGVSLSLCGLAVLLMRKWIWYVGLDFGSIGTSIVAVTFVYQLSHF